MRIGSTTGYIAWHGSSTAFARWRCDLAYIAEFAVFLPSDRGSAPHPILDNYNIAAANARGDWDTMPADPLLVLLAHSDRDGYIRPAQAGPLADRLTELLPQLHSRWHDVTGQFIAALQRAAEAGDDLTFQ